MKKDDVGKLKHRVRYIADDPARWYYPSKGTIGFVSDDELYELRHRGTVFVQFQNDGCWAVTLEDLEILD